MGKIIYCLQQLNFRVGIYKRDYHGWETDVYETREDKNKNE